jgi:hypothetical protein
MMMIASKSAGGSGYRRLEAVLRAHGMMARGGVQFVEDGPDLPNGRRVKSLVLVGHVGSSFWPFFEVFRSHDTGADPLDAWSKHVVEPIAADFGCLALYPFEKPWWPFQQWIARSEGLKASPLGILIHPEYGLWHGYRAALGFEELVEIPVSLPLPHPCDSCADRPCISACPAQALADGRFDLQTCRGFLASKDGETTCIRQGCASRNACPIGSEHRYNEAHLRFHMEALELPGCQ